ncbi:MAG: ComEC family DNA internalization-related competence protein, partial [Okeania sp. SIO2H7]|nr:ComEC family DNA internalization-related competence protein [Okeania sp. SIO2H7]
MNQAAAVILCFAYIAGLLLTKVSCGKYMVLGLGIVLALVLPGFRQSAVRRSLKDRRKTKRENKERKKRTPNLILLSTWLWLTAGFIGFAASFYLHARMPEPGVNDISTLIQENGSAQAQILTVSGKVTSMPRKTRAERSQFWLRVTQVSELIGNDGAADPYKEATGKLYVTVPLLQANGLHPNQWVSVTGTLYKPKPPSNPGSFDFPAYLAKQGAFAAFKGRQVSMKSFENSKTLGLWKVRRRIVRSQSYRLGVPKGTLVSAMVLGRRAVDLSYELRDRFLQVGLAHVLAASGFHVSLILGTVLFFAKGLSGGTRFGLGFLTLIIYVSLTGFSPSILRAAMMGFAALIAIASERQVKPLGALLVAAAILLLVNPLWIWDLGFQLSFLATLGLLATVEPLMKMLDWLPTPIASLVAVPIAASV